MENIYSKFYTGRKDPFGIGTWDSNNNVRRKLHHSNSQPYFFSHLRYFFRLLPYLQFLQNMTMVQGNLNNMKHKQVVLLHRIIMTPTKIEKNYPII